ncbi:MULTISPECIES: ribosomal protection-like ABC-F family protein [unclassified Niallia]|uniref:ribosomal protection-like ABC-F family protein n=1 Tax=unclassified Niallia TaxID=2837522 RepID=UPI001EDA44D4|nr:MULTISPECIES: ABC-F type ribosomal protection protein [unclassified Niallia]MDL0434322.1 ABC-F type ribosomal protection protein [Niallia sp. SS-2023]UPO89069.1 ABC-F type ribosomal protection protein [Niallia sp. Man26]
MKELLKLHHISYEIKDHLVFEEVTASVQQGDIIGIIGNNGAGKSTLLHLLNEDITPSNGELQWLVPLTSWLVVQESATHLSADKSVAEVKLLEKWQVPDSPYEYLSGGEKLKARLAEGFAQDADMLLLDEPTNHLDDKGLQMLQKQVKEYKGTIVLVSHDRYFLDEVATKIWAIEGKKLVEHKGNYTAYMEARKQKRLVQQREYEKQQKLTERIEGQIKELNSWSKKAHAESTKKEGVKEYYRVKAKRMDAQVKSKQKRLEKELEKNKVEPVEGEHSVYFSLQSNSKVGKRFLEVKGLAKAYGKRTLFKDVHFTIKHGERVALTGPNGSGKTTLLKMIVGSEQGIGEIWVSPTAKIGYLSQEVFDLPLEQTPSQLFHRETFAERGNVQTLMKQLGFIASQWREPIGSMSMGERVKCKLMAYILEDKDVLLLDEPTNHLDLASREQLEETLAQYNGTLIVVSHDRYFLEKTTTSSLLITNNGVRKQWQSPAAARDDVEELRLKLETERQEILGRLSFMMPHDKEYSKLDAEFNELTKKLKELS